MYSLRLASAVCAVAGLALRVRGMTPAQAALYVPARVASRTQHVAEVMRATFARASDFHCGRPGRRRLLFPIPSFCTLSKSHALKVNGCSKTKCLPEFLCMSHSPFANLIIYAACAFTVGCTSLWFAIERTLHGGETLPILRVCLS